MLPPHTRMHTHKVCRQTHSNTYSRLTAPGIHCSQHLRVTLLHNYVSTHHTLPGLPHPIAQRESQLAANVSSNHPRSAYNPRSEDRVSGSQVYCPHRPCSWALLLSLVLYRRGEQLLGGGGNRVKLSLRHWASGRSDHHHQLSTSCLSGSAGGSCGSATF